MPKITDEDLEAIQLRLFKKDLDILRQIYTPTVGVNKAIRTIVRSFVKQLEAKTNVVIDEMEKETAQAE